MSLNKLFAAIFTLILLTTNNSSGQNISNEISKYEIINLDSRSLIREYEQSASRNENMTMSLGDWNLNLTNSGLISPDYQLKRATKNGLVVAEDVKAPICLSGYTDEGHRVSLTITDNFVSGMILVDDEFYTVQPLGNFLPSEKNTDQFILYKSSDFLGKSTGTCGTEEDGPSELPPHRDNDNSRELACQIVNYSLSLEYSMVEKHGSAGSAAGHVASVSNNMQTFYYTGHFNDDVQFNIVEQIVATSGNPHPWTTQSGTSIDDNGNLIEEFKDWGNGNVSSSAVLASMWTNRDFVGTTIGIAYVNVICSPSFKYSILQDYSSNVNSLRILVAHELGHNFGASHISENPAKVMNPSVSPSITNWSATNLGVINGTLSNATCLGSCGSGGGGGSVSANFTSSTASGCAPESITYTDQSTGNPTSWSWSFPGGTPSSSTQQNPTITYNNGGTFNVTLTASKSGSNDTETKNNFIDIEGAPDISYSYSASGTTIFFNIQGGVSGTTYSWNFGDGTSGSGANPNHTYSTSGTYSVSVTATNSCGSDIYNNNVNVEGPPEPDFVATSTNVCVGQFVTFTNTTTGQYNSSSWSFQGGNPSSSTATSPSVSYSTPGNYDVSLTVFTGQGQFNVNKTNYISVTNGPTAAFTYTVDGTSVQFNNNSINASSYAWSYGDGSSSNGVNPSHTFPGSGTYSVELTANSNGCSADVFTQSVEIVALPTANFSANTLETCEGETITYSNLSTNASSYSWTFEGGTPSSSNSTNPTITYNTIGNHNVSLIATNSSGSDDEIKTNYISIISPPSAGFTYSIVDNSVTFSNSSTNSSSYSWNFGDGASSSQMNPVRNYDGPGTYVVTLTALNGDCDPDELEQTIEVNLMPTADFSSNTEEICMGESVTYTNLSSGGDSYLWTFENGNPSTSTLENPPAISYNAPGQHDVSLEVTNTNGSDLNTFEEFILVNDFPSAQFSYAISENTVTFTNTSLNADSYLWEFGDGSTSTSQNPTKEYSESLVYDVILTATSDCGSDDVEQSISLVQVPVADFTFNIDESCYPMVVTYTNTSQNNPVSLLWTFEGGTPSSSTEENPTITYNTAGTFDAALTATNSEGDDTKMENDLIEAVEQISVDFGYTNDGSQSVIFSNLSNGVIENSWSFGDGTSSNVNNPNKDYEEPGIYEVTLTVSNGDCEEEITKSIEVGSLPTASFTTATPSVCPEVEIQFENTTLNIASAYTWSFDGGSPSSSSLENPIASFEEAGIHTVTLIATNDLGSDTFNLDVEILELPYASFDFDIEDLAVTINNQFEGHNTNLYDFGDGMISSELNPSHTYDVPGVYTISSTVNSENCGSDVISEEVTIGMIPTAGFTVESTDGCAPFTVTFENTSIGNAQEYSWSFEGGEPSSSNAENPTIVFESLGNFGVTLTSTNALGSDESAMTEYINVIESPTAEFSIESDDLTVVIDNSSCCSTPQASWSFGDGNNSDEVDPEHTYDEPGVYDITLTSSNVCGTADSSMQVTIGSAPTASFTSNENEGCAPFTVTFTNTSINHPTSTRWIIEGQEELIGQEINFEFTQKDTYNVQMITSNALGEDQILKENLIIVNDLPSSGFTFTSDGFEVDFENESEFSNSYLWDFGDNTTSTQPSPTHVFTTEDVFEAALISFNDCGSDTMTQLISTLVVPTAEFEAGTSGAGSGEVGITSLDLCLGDVVTYEDKTENTIAGRIWNFEGGTPSTSEEQNPEVTYTSSGEYNVQLIVFNEMGRDTIVIQNFVNVAANVNSQINGTVIGNVVSLESLLENEVSSYWILEDGSKTDSNENQELIIEANGLYSVSLIGENECSSDTSIFEFEINVFPSASIVFEDTMSCEGTSLVLSAGESAEAMYVWEALDVNGVTVTSSDAQLTLTEPGEYVVSLTRENEYGVDISILDQVFQILPGPKPTLAIDWDGYQLNGLGVAENGNGFTWMFGDGNTAMGDSVTHKYEEDGTYEVTFRVFGDCGFVDAIQEIEIIKELPVVSFSADSLNGCKPLIINYADESINRVDSILWYFPGGEPEYSNDKNVEVSYNIAGFYDVVLTAYNENGMTTKTFENYASVIGVPEGFKADIVENELDLTINFSDLLPEGTIVSYDFGDGNILTGAVENYTYDKSGTYTITITIATPCSTFTTGKTVTLTSTSLTELEIDNTLLINPNPSSGLLNIDGAISDYNGEYNIKLFEQSGRLIKEWNGKANGTRFSQQVDISNYTSGIYFVKVRTSKYSTYRKIMKVE